MSVQSNIKKGKELEDFVADKLVAMGIDRSAIRQIGSGSGKRKGDIHNNIGWTFECKNTKHLDFKGASEQVKREAMGYQKEVIVWHPPFKSLEESVAIININDFLELIKFYKDHCGKADILDKFAVKNNLDKAIFHLKNVVKEL